MYKVFVVVTILAAANMASAEYQATSFASFNDNHNSVSHINSAPAYPKYAAPAAPAAVYASPALSKVALPVLTKYAAPVYQSAPLAAHSYSFPTASGYATPIVTKYAAAPITKYAPVPAYSSPKEEYAPAKYEFVYAIQDPHTGDYHSQEEHRDGHSVVGQYSLHEADGTVRIVKYSDDGHGFNAVVEKQGQPTQAPAYKKVIAATPYY